MKRVVFNPFVTRSESNSYLVPLSVAALLAGFLLTLAWIANDSGGRPGVAGIFSSDDLEQSAAAVQTENTRLSEEVQKLREENTKLQKAIADNSVPGLEELNKSLQETKVFAGLTEVVGEGVTVTLRDGNLQDSDAPADSLVIHDTDIVRVLNELFNAGAEAIAINGRRVSFTTDISCAGSVILIDGSKEASPFKIQAIGDSEVMAGALKTPGRVVDELAGTAPNMVKIEAIQEMRLPAYAGPTTFKIAKVPEEPPAAKEGKTAN